MAKIQRREDFASAAAATSAAPSRQAQFFEFIADLTDEDGALALAWQ
jgi:hypothetical protein